MLIRFSVENFLSFREREELSLVKGAIRHLPSHVMPAVAPGAPAVLKAATIYGANASGKSNLIKAIAYARQTILAGTKPGDTFPITPFRLDPKSAAQPTRFEFEIAIGHRVYAYGYIATHSAIQEEWLVEVRKTDRPIFSRAAGKFDLGGVDFKNAAEQNFLEFTSKQTRPNSLFLTECNERNVQPNLTKDRRIFEVFNWFKSTLAVVFAESLAADLVSQMGVNADLQNACSRMLHEFDTGIDSLGMQEINLEQLPIPEELRSSLGDGDHVVHGPQHHRHVIRKRGASEPRAFKFVTTHRTDGKPVTFDFNDESDGTRRLFDLFPGLLRTKTTDTVLVVDELNRSLHPSLLAAFLRLFFTQSTSGSQLVFTTHETGILRQELLRRDEIWIMEKDHDGASHLKSIQDFRIRADKDIRKAYLHGRFGGVPMITNPPWSTKESKRAQRAKTV